MNHHLFVPYEIAMLAKESGFDESCFTTYILSKKLYEFWNEKNPTHEDVTLIKNSELQEGYYAAPLYQQLIDWFREKHNLYIEITLWGDGIGYTGGIKQIVQGEMEKEIYMVKSGVHFMHNPFNYSKLLEETIKEAFKLIKK